MSLEKDVDQAVHRILRRFGRGPDLGVFRSTKLGNQVSFVAADAGQSGKRILEANILECEAEKAYDAASWVLTLRTDATFASPGVAGNYNYVLANVTLGAGATQTTFDVDISRGDSFQCPAGNVTITAFLPPLIQGNAGLLFLPTSQLITAAIHRTTSTAKPTRTFLWRATVASTSLINPATGFGGNVPIPPLATGVFAFDNGTGAGMWSAGSFLSLSNDGGIALVSYSAAQMQASVNAGIALPVPSAATNFTATAGVGRGGADFSQEAIQFILDI